MFFLFKRNFIWNGDDIYYNYQRISGISDNLTNGILAPNVSLSNFGKIGYGVNIFYPWLTLLPFKLASILITKPVLAYYFGLLFYFYASFVISHYSMKSLTGSTKSAIIFSLVYNLSTYRLIQILSRGSLGEYIASIFLPLCFLGFYNVFYGDEKKWQPLAIGMSLLIYTHILTTFMCIIFFLLIILLFVFKLQINIKRFFSLLKSIIFTIFSTLIFTVPFVSEELYQQYATPDPQILQGISLSKLLLSSLANSSKRAVEGNSYNIGILMIFGIILGLIALKKSSKLFKAIFLVFLTTLFLSTNLFPWHFLQNTVIQVIQYPFRILMFSTFFGSLVFANSLEVILGEIFEKKFIWVSSLILITTISLWGSSINNSLNSLLTDKKSIITNKMIEKKLIPDSYLQQYIPNKAQSDFPNMVQHIVLLNNKKIIQVPVVKGHSNYFKIKNVKESSKIILPVVRYKYTKVIFEGKNVRLDKRKDGILSFKAPYNKKSATIKVSYWNGRLFTINSILSLMSFIYIILSYSLEEKFKDLKSKKVQKKE